MAKRFSVETVFNGIDKISKIAKGMGRSIASFARISKAKLKSIGRAVTKLSKKFSKILAIGATAGFLALNVAIADTAKTGVEFEQAMVTAAIKFPKEIKKGSKEFTKLEEATKKTGRETEFGATQAANALNFMAMAGFNARQSMAALPGVVDLATVAALGLDRATDIATDSLGAFGLMTKDPIELTTNLARVNDVLAKTTLLANTDMETLFETIKSGAADFTAAGQTIETFGALTAAMAASGKKGEASGTILRNVMVRLAAPTKQAGILIKKLGIRTADQNGNFRDALDILEDLQNGLKGLGTKQRTAAVSTIFGVKAQAGINIVLKTSIEKVREYRKTLEGAGGTTKRIAAVMRDTLQGRIDSLKSAFEGLQLTVFDFEKGPLSGLIERITEVIRNVDNFISSNKEFGASLTTDINNTVIGAIKVFGLFMGAIIALKTVVLAGNAAFIIFKTTLLLFKVVMIAAKAAIVIGKIAMFAFNVVMAANPILLIATAIAALIIGILLLVTHWETVKKVVANVWDSIVAKIKGAVELIKGFLATVTSPFKELFEGISGLKEKFSFIFGSKEERETEERKPKIITPEERITKSFSEQVNESKSTLIIKDETGRAELEKKGNGGPQIALAASGGF